MDIIVGGVMDGEPWRACYAFHQYDKHPNVDMIVDTAVNAIEEIASFLRDIGIKCPTRLVIIARRTWEERMVSWPR